MVSKQFTTQVPRQFLGTSDGRKVIPVKVQGKDIDIKIPKGLRAGDKFKITVNLSMSPIEEVENAFVSTLPAVPGMEIVQSKPIIWGSVSDSFAVKHATNQQEMGQKVGQLLQNAQNQIIEQVIENGCNACLSMSYNECHQRQFWWKKATNFFYCHGVRYSLYSDANNFCNSH